MRIFHPIIFVITLAVCSAYFVALAQMPPMGGGGGGGYPPPPGGGSGGGGSGGGATYFTLTVAPNGNGSGTVSGGSISCGAQCTGQFLGGSAITLMATPDTGSVFGGWSGDCTGSSSSCSLTLSANKSVTALFNVEASGAGGGGQDDFGDYPDSGDAYEFQLAVLSKKPPKKQKINVGISTLWQDPRGDIQRIFFGGSAREANWRVGGTATDPIAQGTLTGKGSVWNIVVGLYTGFVRSTFVSKAANWIAVFYSDQGASRAELFTKIFYQEETAVDADGNESKLGLLLNGTTIFGNYKSSPLSGSFFIVDVDTVPAALPAGALAVPVPHLDGPAIPMDTIIELLTRAGIFARDMFVSVAHAAAQSLTPAQIFDRLATYKKVDANMKGIQEKFARLDFNNPNTDWDAVQELVDAYDTDQKKLDYLVTQLGRARLFVRGGDWLSTGGNAAYDLMDAGVDMVPAVLVSQVSGPFDFYTVQTVDGKEIVFAGTCTGRNDSVTGEQVACVLRKPTAAQSKAVLKANPLYEYLASKAHEALGSIESALFAPA